MCVFIYQHIELEKKTPKSVGKNVVPNYDAQLIFVPNSDDKPNFVSNYNGSYCMSLITTASQIFSLILTVQPFFVPNYDDQLFLAPNNDASL
jgi:hypothetical protein